MKRLILFLIRRRLGLKKYEHFRFANQKSPYNFYYFTEDKLMKCWKDLTGQCTPSSVSLNWILDDECEIEKVN